QIIHSDFPYGTTRFPVIILVNQNGTPGDPNDDWGAFAFNADPFPDPGQWMAGSWPIPSQQTSLPTGWDFLQFGPGAPSPNWNTLITHVDRLEFAFGDPTRFYIFQMWEAGGDAIAIYSDAGSACYANCDHSTAVPFLNVNDFVCFQSEFAAGDSRANCDGS